MSSAAHFNGFSAESLSFLDEISANNNKPWFKKNRDRYEQHLLEPLRNMVRDLGPRMHELDSEFEIQPAINRTISRIYRDTRFSKDKSPLRDVVWITFKRPGRDWASSACGYFFELSSEAYRYGMGFYDAAPKIMRAYREMIDEDPDGFAQLVAPLNRQRTFELVGDCYKRPIDPEKPSPISRWYERKTVCLICRREADKTLFSPKLTDRLFDAYETLAPCYHFFRKACLRAV